jgi:hypothetical protein
MNRIASLAPLVALGLALASAPAAAQAINIDVNNLYGTPSSSFGGAASQPGVWNSVLPTVGSAPLVDIGGNATGATITAAGMAASYSFDNLGTTGDDQALMDDLSDLIRELINEQHRAVVQDLMAGKFTGMPKTENRVVSEQEKKTGKKTLDDLVLDYLSTKENTAQ